MKLKNRKTGEIADRIWWDSEVGELCVDGKRMNFYGSLAELNSDWEDVPEEPKGYYFITTSGLVKYDYTPFCAVEEDRKAIGNYFSSREEAELAVRKLKAFKRLKDEGMIKYSFHKEKTGIDLDFYNLVILAPRDKDSLDLLFGVEE